MIFAPLHSPLPTFVLGTKSGARARSGGRKIIKCNVPVADLGHNAIAVAFGILTAFEVGGCAVCFKLLSDDTRFGKRTAIQSDSLLWVIDLWRFQKGAQLEIDNEV